MVFQLARFVCKNSDAIGFYYFGFGLDSITAYCKCKSYFTETNTSIHYWVLQIYLYFLTLFLRPTAFYQLDKSYFFSWIRRHYLLSFNIFNKVVKYKWRFSTSILVMKTQFMHFILVSVSLNAWLSLKCYNTLQQKTLHELCVNW